MKYLKVKCMFRSRKLRLAVVFVALLLAVHTCLYPRVFSMTITAFLDDSDSVAVVSDVEWSPTFEYIGKQKLVFGIKNDWMSLKGYAEAIPAGQPYSVEQVQSDGSSVTIATDSTCLTFPMINSEFHITLPDDEQVRWHWHSEKPPRIIPPDNPRKKWLLQFMV